MKKSRHPFLVAIVFSSIALMLSVSFIAQPQATKLTGTWNVVVETSEGSGNPVFVLTQVNDTLITGTYSGQLGEAPVKGTVKANKINIKFLASEMTIEYIGTVDGNSMKGKVIFGSLGEGTFTGKKKENQD